MAWGRKFLGLAVVAVFLAACSGGRKSFETEGLIAPLPQCRIKPSEVGEAERLRAIDEGNGCEVRNAWRIYSVANISFSQPATLNCGMADPLNDWLQNVVQPAAQRRFSESVVSVDVAASYSCRPRNNRSGNKMSEHGYGNAIDISAFTLESGRKVAVREGWSGSSDERAFLRLVRAEACEDFMTVLGPGSDRYHRDHIHLDLQNRRSGNHYCH
ncbi:MAG TPA: extensin family protein [Aestuariivirga sp.]|nr:extensin family protein [Aestuariivirga sp.]